ncbi:hypothetical protein M9H77_21631 [Catharanthus roseus]|uniref:Uncharacterized protein n=1 Tax=Catharanthus roseus TaxID=4058 RepID=A0ACC0AMW4_CATRO|nr:hypothetical protein M9H77_21631 [Catharanthus roseus]
MPWGEMTLTLHDVELILGVPAYGRAVDLHYSRDQLIAVIQIDLGILYTGPRVFMQRNWLGTGHCLRYSGSITSFKRSETFCFPHGMRCFCISIASRRTCLIESSNSSGGVNAFRHILLTQEGSRLFTVVHPSHSSQDTKSCECSTWFSCSNSCPYIDQDDVGKEERFDRITELVKLHY